MVTLQSLGPIQNYNFRWGSNLHSVDLSQKERTEANVLGRHLAEEVHLNQRRWWLYNFGPHRKLGSNLHSVGLSQKECTEANVRASTGQHINSTNPELESCKGTALAGFEPVTICFRDCFKMPQELRGGGGVSSEKSRCWTQTCPSPCWSKSNSASYR